MADQKTELLKLEAVIDSALDKICRMSDAEYRSGLESFKQRFEPIFGSDFPCVLKMIENNRTGYKSTTN